MIMGVVTTAVQSASACWPADLEEVCLDGGCVDHLQRHLDVIQLVRAHLRVGVVLGHLSAVEGGDELHEADSCKAARGADSGQL